VVERESRLGEPVKLARLPVHVCDTLTVELGDARELTLGETVELMLAARVAEAVVVPEPLWLRESVSEVVKVGLCVPLRLGLGEALLLRLTRALVLVALGDTLPVALGHRVKLEHGEALGLPVPLSVGERVRLELAEAVKEPVAVGHADEERDTERVPLTHVVAVAEPLADCVVEPQSEGDCDAVPDTVRDAVDECEGVDVPLMDAVAAPDRDSVLVTDSEGEDRGEKERLGVTLPVEVEDPGKRLGDVDVVELAEGARTVGLPEGDDVELFVTSGVRDTDTL
jgi:hypothetical protein